MIGSIVAFKLGDKFSDQAVRKIAEGARPKFEGMAGLRFKAFTYDAAKREATNFYVWESEQAAKQFFTDQTVDRISGLYGVRPSIQYVEIATLIENSKKA